MGLLRAIDRGTMLSISARREDSPMTDSICRSSASSMPMWRAMNSDGVLELAERAGGLHQHGTPELVPAAG